MNICQGLIKLFDTDIQYINIYRALFNLLPSCYPISRLQIVIKTVLKVIWKNYLIDIGSLRNRLCIREDKRIMDDQRLLVEIIKYVKGQTSFETDIVIKETTLSLIVNRVKIISIACLDDKLKELGTGYLLSEGLVTDISGIRESRLCERRTRLEIEADLPESAIRQYLATSESTTGCGGGISGSLNSFSTNSFSGIPLKLVDIPELMKKFQHSSVLFKQTGGVHSAALILPGKISFFAEDIGRHNAVDKVIGEALLRKEKIEEYSLMISGRISSEIVRKAARLKIPLILSQAAPTSRAISIAWRQGIYLIGFARGNKYNIYTGLKEIPLV